MDPISVPAPPRSAYNENRRVSDLLFSQLKHFQHVERKHGALGIPAALSRDIHTEGGAARYITAVTRALRGTVPPQPAELAVVAPPRPAKKPRRTVAITAASTPAPAKSSAAKKAVAKRRTTRKTPEKK